MKIITLQPTEFDNYAKKHKYRSYYQSSAYGSTMAEFGWNVHYLGIIDETETLIGASLILYKEVFMNNKYAYAPRGLLFDYDKSFLVKEFTDRLRSLLGKQGFMYLKIDPYIPANIKDNNGNMININNDVNIIMANLKNADFNYQGKNLNFENEKARFEALVLLNQDIKEIYHQFNKNTRHKIKKAIKFGVEVTKDKDLNVTDLYEFIKSKHASSIEFYQTLCEKFKPNIDLYYAKLNTEQFVINSKESYERELENNDNLSRKIQEEANRDSQKKLLNMKMESDKLINVYKNNLIEATDLLKKYPDGLPIGGALSIIYDNAAYLVIEGFDQRYSHLNPNYLLKWNMIKDYHSQNLKYFNLNAVSGDFSKGNKYEGLNEMKLSFNPIVVENIGEFELVLNSLSYNLYKSLNKKKDK